jgi:hypothetical protein
MKKLLFILIGIILFGCALKHDQRMVGTFVSDKETTMAYLQSTGKFSERQLEIFSRILGKLRVECDVVKCVSILDDYIDDTPYRVIERGSDYFVVESEFLYGKIQHKIVFTDDGYWAIGGGAGPDYREKFKRISKSIEKHLKPEELGK